MFFKKAKKKEQLQERVEKVFDTGYVFANINNDLGAAVEDGADDWPPLLLMAYAYARRASVAALYIQGVVDEDLYDHVRSFFKNMQYQTGHTVAFQKEAFSIAVTFMQGYNPSITSLLSKKLVQIAEQYEIQDIELNDEELFYSVIETMREEQESGSNL